MRPRRRPGLLPRAGGGRAGDRPSRGPPRRRCEPAVPGEGGRGAEGVAEEPLREYERVFRKIGAADQLQIASVMAVTVFDGRVTYSNTAQVDEQAVLALADAAVHVLPAEYGFDFRTHRPLLPGGEIIPKAPADGGE